MRAQAALAPSAGKASGTSVLSVSVGPNAAEKFVLCHLTPGTCDQWSLDIGFAPEDGEVTFHLTGKQAVHLTGFTEMEDDMDDMDDDDMADDDGMGPTAVGEDDEVRQRASALSLCPQLSAPLTSVASCAG